MSYPGFLQIVTSDSIESHLKISPLSGNPQTKMKSKIK